MKRKSNEYRQMWVREDAFWTMKQEAAKSRCNIVDYMDTLAKKIRYSEEEKERNDRRGFDVRF